MIHPALMPTNLTGQLSYQLSLRCLVFSGAPWCKSATLRASCHRCTLYFQPCAPPNAPCLHGHAPGPPSAVGQHSQPRRCHCRGWLCCLTAVGSAANEPMHACLRRHSSGLLARDLGAACAVSGACHKGPSHSPVCPHIRSELRSTGTRGPLPGTLSAVVPIQPDRESKSPTESDRIPTRTQPPADSRSRCQPWALVVSCCR